MAAGGTPMSEPSKSHLAALVERRHGIAPTRGEEVHVLLDRPGERPVERVVHVFDLPGQASPYRALAWVERTPDGAGRIVTKIHGPDWRSNEEVLSSARLRDRKS
jgi:hypothetical protein